MTKEPRPSATIVLLRSGDDMPEVLMVQRHADAAFGRTFAFPGGVVERVDREVHSRCPDPTAGRANRQLRVDAGGLDYYSAAIRELFEETGVLLARRTDGRWAFAGAGGKLDDLRRDLNAGRRRWPDLLNDHDLYLAGDALRYFAHWITPTTEPKRFSTRFFVARLPEGQDARHDGVELTDSRWMTAQDVVRAYGSGAMKLIFPTYFSLQSIADCKSCDEILSWAGERQSCGVAAVLPAIVKTGGKIRVVLPDDPEYPRDSGH